LELREHDGRADVGHLSVFLLDTTHLEEGEGVYIAPGTLHSYVRGNIVECMANSDNVVRAGLTSKFQDYSAILDVVSYETGPIPILGQRIADGRTTYSSPADEFEVSRWRLGPDETVREAPDAGPRVFLVTRGDVVISWRSQETMLETAYHRGQSFFLPASMPQWDMTSQRSAELFGVRIPLR
jgi:mannose-6-phosphate isomerase